MSLWTPHVTRCPSYALTWSTRPLDGHDAYMVRADKSTVRACNKTISNPQTSHQGSSVQTKLVIAFTCRRRRQPNTLHKTRTSKLLNCNWLFLLFIFGRFETLRWGWSGCDVPFHVTANWLVGFGWIGRAHLYLATHASHFLLRNRRCFLQRGQAFFAEAILE